MYRTSTETVTFTKTYYSCDLCKEDFKAGMKPTLCSICGREVHRGCAQYSEHESLGLKWICVRCLAVGEETIPKVLLLRQRFWEDLDMVKVEWKQVSLQETKKEEDHV